MLCSEAKATATSAGEGARAAQATAWLSILSLSRDQNVRRIFSSNGFDRNEAQLVEIDSGK
jgi:hypothetical protein